MIETFLIVTATIVFWKIAGVLVAEFFDYDGEARMYRE